MREKTYPFLKKGYDACERGKQVLKPRAETGKKQIIQKVKRRAS